MRRLLLIAALTGALLAGGTLAIAAIGSQGSDDPAGTWVATFVERSGGGGRHGGNRGGRGGSDD